MPFAITGGRYAAASVSSVGTTTVTVGTTPFVQADFTKQRLVGLWTSGAVFKGMTWVRRWVSTSQIELERPFFDPATGLTVTQVVGDQVLVSKDFTESVVAGLSVSGRVVSITDTCTFGVNGDQMGVCLYDENKLVNATVSTLLSGGLVVLGKLDDYATNSVSSSIDWQSTNSNPILCNNSAVNFCGYGGRWESSAAPAYFIGAGGAAGNTVVLNGIECPNDLLTNTAGGNWARNPDRHQLVNCYSITAATNAIMRRWGNGIIRGGRYKVPNNSNAPISIFGSDAAGTYTVASNPGDRAVILDMGNGPALVRSNTAVALTFNFTNLITTDFRSVNGLSGALNPNPNGTNTFRFSDTYTNLQSGTVGVILNNSGAVADSVASSTASWSPSLLRRTCVGATVTVNATSWTYGFKRYGFQAVSGSITPTTYDLGTAGTADNVVFGGIVNQFADEGVTLSKSAAEAILDVDDLDQLYDAAINWGSANPTNAQYPSLSAYPATKNGTECNFGAVNILVDGAAAAAFSINTTTHTATVKSLNLAAGAKFKSIATTGTVTFVNGATSSGIAIEDANGVRVTVRKSGGGNFNIAARYGSGGTYTDLGYQADVSTITYTVPKGQPVEVVMWALGYVTYSRLISTVNGGGVFDAEMTLDESIDTSLDVSPYLPSIALSLDTSGASPVFVITFNAPMTIAGIELGKAVIHRLVGQEVALKAGFPPGSAATIVINSDEITNQLPAARLALGAGLSVTDRVYLDFFINTAPALTINPAYVINPPRADGNQVVILRAKPALDASVMALAVRQEIERTGGMLDGKASQASVTALATTNQAEHNATQAAIAALPAPLTATETRAQVDAALTAYDAAVPADLATLATAAQVTALGAPLQASSYTAPPSATSTAQAVRAELATELGLMDAAVSSRLGTAAYTTPPSAAEIATQVEIAILNEDDGRQVIEAIADKIKAEEVAAGVIAAAVRTEIKPDLQIINAGVKKASLAVPHGLDLPS